MYNIFEEKTIQKTTLGQKPGKPQISTQKPKNKPKTQTLAKNLDSGFWVPKTQNGNPGHIS